MRCVRCCDLLATRDEQHEPVHPFFADEGIFLLVSILHVSGCLRIDVVVCVVLLLLEIAQAFGFEVGIDQLAGFRIHVGVVLGTEACRTIWARVDFHGKFGRHAQITGRQRTPSPLSLAVLVSDAAIPIVD